VYYHREAVIETVKIARQDRIEWYITTVPSSRSVASVKDQVKEVYDSLADKLKAEEAHILFERIYADKAAWGDMLSQRETSLAKWSAFDNGVPNFFDGGPCKGSGLAGVQIWAVTGPTVIPIVENGRTCGRLFEGREGSFLTLSNITSEHDENRRAYAERVFGHIADILQAQGFSFKTDILRTWIYLEDILDWYDEFNVARSRVYRSRGITSPGGFLPASTGIGFRVPGDVSCTMDVLALRRNPDADMSIRRCYNPLQNEAPEYGSAFTRGTELIVDGIRTTFVSGTAAINELGQTIHEDDVRMQIIRTVKNIQTLLEQSGMDWSAISQGTLFAPSRDLAQIYHEVEKEMNLPKTPILEVEGTVCRANLWVEIEVTATAAV